MYMWGWVAEWGCTVFKWRAAAAAAVAAATALKWLYNELVKLGNETSSVSRMALRPVLAAAATR